MSDPSLKLFFEERASQVSKAPSLLEQCWVSGREPRLWMQDELYADLMGSLKQQLALEPDHTLLEVGCAAGFLARGLAPLCRHYTGIDLSEMTIDRARSLELANATFRGADARALPFSEGSFDRVISSDVFTNFEERELVRAVVTEMVRVTRPGGRVLVGSLPDERTKERFLAHVADVNRQLDARFGPAPKPRLKAGALSRLKQLYWKKVRRVEPRVVGYYFKREDFVTLGDELGVTTEILDIHPKNPYFGFRFNVLYEKDPPSPSVFPKASAGQGHR